MPVGELVRIHAKQNLRGPGPKYRADRAEWLRDIAYVVARTRAAYHHRAHQPTLAILIMLE